MGSILDKFQNLGRYKDTAPHKPLLVLALLDWIEKLSLEENRIPISKGLFELFEYYWEKLYKQTGRKRIHYPIFYLKSDNLGWHVIINGELLSKEEGVRNLEKQAANGHFSEEVWQFLNNSEHRDLVRLAIMETYFPGQKNVIFPPGKAYSLGKYEDEFFEEKRSTYRILTAKTHRYVRDSYFRIRLFGLYKNTCSMTRMYIDPPRGILQACHIEPHSSTGNNSVTNGIVLCANMHAAFDEGYIGISQDYEILINDSKFEETKGNYSLIRLKENRLFLPKKEKHWPAQEFLEKHRRKHSIK